MQDLEFKQGDLVTYTIPHLWRKAMGMVEPVQHRQQGIVLTLNARRHNPLKFAVAPLPRNLSMSSLNRALASPEFGGVLDVDVDYWNVEHTGRSLRPVAMQSLIEKFNAIISSHPPHLKTISEAETTIPYGSIGWANVPYCDQTETKKRPVFCLSDRRSDGTVLVLKAFSESVDGDFAKRYPLPRSKGDSGGAKVRHLDYSSLCSISHDLIEPPKNNVIFRATIEQLKEIVLGVSAQVDKQRDREFTQLAREKAAESDATRLARLVHYRLIDDISAQHAEIASRPATVDEETGSPLLSRYRIA